MDGVDYMALGQRVHGQGGRREPPASRPDTPPMAGATTGATFTVTVTVSNNVPPLPSLAAIQMTAVPRALAATARLE